MTPALRAMVGRGARAVEIHAGAVEQGVVDPKRYSAQLLLNGLTTVNVVTSVVSMES